MPCDTKSKRFVLKAAVLPRKQRTALYIWDVTKEAESEQIAKWEIQDNSVPQGNISLDNWKYGIVGQIMFWQLHRNMKLRSLLPTSTLNR